MNTGTERRIKIHHHLWTLEKEITTEEHEAREHRRQYESLKRHAEALPPPPPKNHLFSDPLNLNPPAPKIPRTAPATVSVEVQAQPETRNVKIQFHRRNVDHEIQTDGVSTANVETQTDLTPHCSSNLFKIFASRKEFLKSP